MNKKYVIIFCLLYVIGAFGNISIGKEIIKVDTPDNFLIKIIPLNKDVPSNYGDAYPLVEIVYPENGTNLPTNYLEVLGYALDPDGMKYMEWTYQWGSYIYHDNETFDFAQYVNFRIQVFNLQPGTHTVTATFYDIYGNTGSDSVTVQYGGNNPPDEPNLPEGPDSGVIGMEYTYSTNSTDSDGDEIKYGWDWDGDNVVDEWTGFYPSGEVIELTHIWSLPGTYTVKVIAKDEKGAQSYFSLPLAVVITDNHAPDQPKKPVGRTYGVTGVSYSYTTYTLDSDEDRIYYMFDWDDGTNSSWKGPYNSGDNISASHIWINKGTFQLKVKAKDDPNSDGDLSDGEESIWSESLTITMSKSKTLGNLFEKMPILNKYFLFFYKQ